MQKMITKSFTLYKIKTKDKVFDLDCLKKLVLLYIIYKMNVCIIGAGIYGLYIADYIITNFSTCSITIYDKNPDIYDESSSKNQNRLHLGFHYPRCNITKDKCKKYYNLFNEKYNFAVEEINENYYAISTESKVDYNTFLSLYTEYELIENKFLSNINGNLIKVNEKLLNYEKLKEYFKFKLKNKVIFKFNTEITNINNLLNEGYDKIFNCTYNQLNTFNNVIFEKCLTLVYKIKNNVNFDCITIMDGEFSSLYKYKKDLYTLTNVKYTPLIKGTFNEIKNYNNYNLNEKIQLFENDFIHYYKDFKLNFEYYDFYESYKCKNNCDNDGRDININIKGNIFSVWCGKLSFIFELDEYIKLFLS